MRARNSIAVIAAVIAADQLAKFFSSDITKNPGLPFGIIVPGLPDGRQGFFNLLVPAVLFTLFVILYFRLFGQANLGFALIVGGALANLADRVYFGYARDFINIGIATMNVADIAIWAGIMLLLINQKLKIKMENYSVKF